MTSVPTINPVSAEKMKAGVAAICDALVNGPLIQLDHDPEATSRVSLVVKGRLVDIEFHGQSLGYRVRSLTIENVSAPVTRNGFEEITRAFLGRVKKHWAEQLQKLGDA